MAGCQLAPPSVDTSTPATCPPASAAVPLTVTWAPLATEVPGAGVEMATVGPVVSVDFVAATSRESRVVGCALMSASRLTWACCIRMSAATGA